MNFSGIRITYDRLIISEILWNIYLQLSLGKFQTLNIIPAVILNHFQTTDIFDGKSSVVLLSW